MKTAWFAAIVGIAAACGGDDEGTSDGADAASGSSGATDPTGVDDDDDDDDGSSAADDAATTGASAGSTGDTAGTDAGESTAADTGSGGTFACGPDLMCSIDAEYCAETIGGAQDSPGFYECAPLPGACQPEPSCACVRGIGCGMMCAQGPEGGITITCFAP